MKTQTYLFVGGQHHGKMLPVSSASLAAATKWWHGERGDMDGMQSPKGKPYAGYRMIRITLDGGGERHVACLASCLLDAQRYGHCLADALCVALDNHERVLRALRSGKRAAPLNAVLDDEPGVPARRSLKQDQDFDPNEKFS